MAHIRSCDGSAGAAWNDLAAVRRRREGARPLGYVRAGDRHGRELAAAQTDAWHFRAVADGSKLSPGMVLFLDASDQELITRDGGTPTPAVTTLSQAMSATDDTITPASVNAVNVGRTIRVDFEKMLVDG